MILHGTEKSALLLMSIGADQASEILKHLTPFEIQELITHMVNIKQFSTEIVNAVLLECYNIAIKNNIFNHNNNDNYLANMLTKALGEKKGNSLLQKALEIRNIKMCITALNSMKPQNVAVLLEKEHPQMIAMILACLDKNQAGQILSFLSNQQRAEIISRIIEFNGIEESCLFDLNKVINNLINSKKLILSDKGGIKTAVNILNTMKMKDENNIIKKISMLDKNIADKIVEEIFSFEKIVNLDNQYIQYVIQHIEKEKLYIALQDTSLIIRKKFFKNMLQSDAHQLMKSLEKKSYISKEAIKNEQKLILMMIKSISGKQNISLEKLGKYYA